MSKRNFSIFNNVHVKKLTFNLPLKHVNHLFWNNPEVINLDGVGKTVVTNCVYYMTFEISDYVRINDDIL